MISFFIKNLIRASCLFVSCLFYGDLALARALTLDLGAVIALEGFNSRQEADLLCGQMQKEINRWSMSTQRLPVCLSIRPNAIEGVYSQAATQSGIGFVISLRRIVIKKQLQLSIKVLHPEDETEPKLLKWEIEDSINANEAISKILKHYNEFDLNKEDFKVALLLAGIPDSNKLMVRQQDNMVVSTETYEPVSFKVAYGKFISEGQKHRNYLAAGLEIAAILGASTLSYYAVPASNNPNNVDWDFNAKSSMRGRFITGEGVRFDDNSFHTNKGHIWAGVSYYTVARTAGLNRMEAFLIGAAASSFWEYFSEYREVVSINDQINTTFGGFIVGEALHQVGKIFQTGSKAGINGILRGVFGSPRKMSNWIEKKANRNSVYDFEDFEANPDIWSRLDLSVGYTRTNKGADAKTIGFNAEVIAIPLFEEPGRAHELLVEDTVYSQLKMEKGKGLNLDTFSFFAKTTLAAYYQKKLGRDEKGNLEGYNLFVGPSMALEIKEELTDQPQVAGSDFRGIVHIVGSTLDLTAYQNGIRFRCIVDVYGDFAMMRSYAFETYASKNSVAQVQSVLRQHGYYYGMGATESLAFAVSYGQWEVGSKFQDTTSSVINSRARFSGSDTDKIQLTDRVKSSRLWVAYQFTKKLRVEVGAEKILRSGTAPGLSISDSELRTYGNLLYQY